MNELINSVENTYSTYSLEQAKKYQKLLDYNNKILAELHETKIELEETKTKLVNVRKIIGSL